VLSDDVTESKITVDSVDVFANVPIVNMRGIVCRVRIIPVGCFPEEISSANRDSFEKLSRMYKERHRLEMMNNILLYFPWLMILFALTDVFTVYYH
jgi:hypothetical protein